MTMDQIFGLQFLLSLLVVGLLALWVVAPRLRRQPVQDALFWLTVPHAFRHLGLVFLVPGVVAPTMPQGFAVAAGYGDLAAGLLAILSLVALKYRWAVALPMVFVFNVVGLVDLANALTTIGILPHFQAAWYIPTFVVPVLLVTHAMSIARLYRYVAIDRKSLGATG